MLLIITGRKRGWLSPLPNQGRKQPLSSENGTSAQRRRGTSIVPPRSIGFHSSVLTDNGTAFVNYEADSRMLERKLTNHLITYHNNVIMQQHNSYLQLHFRTFNMDRGCNLV